LQQQLAAAVEYQHMYSAEVRPQPEDIPAADHSDWLVLLVNHIDKAGKRRRGHVSDPTTGEVLTDPGSGSAHLAS
jgi:hypothetical protein